MGNLQIKKDDNKLGRTRSQAQRIRAESLTDTAVLDFVRAEVGANRPKWVFLKWFALPENRQPKYK